MVDLNVVHLCLVMTVCCLVNYQWGKGEGEGEDENEEEGEGADHGKMRMHESHVSQ